MRGPGFVRPAEPPASGRSALGAVDKGRNASRDGDWHGVSSSPRFGTAGYRMWIRAVLHDSGEAGRCTGTVRREPSTGGG